MYNYPSNKQHKQPKTHMDLENSPVVLVDILHDENATMLVSPQLEQAFTHRVLSRLSPSTKICVEGLNTGPQGIGPEHFNYSQAVAGLWPHCSSTHLPILYGADPRCRVDWMTNQTLMIEVDQILKILDNHLTVTPEPESIQQALEWVRNGQVNCELNATPTLQIKNLADKIYRLEKVWVKNYGDLVRICLRSSTRVYVVAGLIHTLNLHFKYSWPIMWLTKDLPWTTPINVYRSGMNFSHFVDKIRRM